MTLSSILCTTYMLELVLRKLEFRCASGSRRDRGGGGDGDGETAAADNGDDGGDDLLLWNNRGFLKSSSFLSFSLFPSLSLSLSSFEGRLQLPRHCCLFDLKGGFKVEGKG